MMTNEEEVAKSARIAELDLRLRNTHARIKSIMRNRRAAVAELNVFTEQLGIGSCHVDEFFSPNVIALATLGIHPVADIKSISGIMSWGFEEKLAESVAFCDKLWKDLNKANNAVQHRRAELYRLALAAKERRA